MNSAETTADDSVALNKADETRADEDDMDNSAEGKNHRPRKRNLYEQILKQLEFYMGDSNLSKDRFLSQKLKENPELPIDLFLTFNKIKNFTTDVKDLVTALKNSNLLSLSEDETKVSRKVPIAQRTNQDECTIYVENVPTDANHEWLQAIFASYGTVLYISIPKFKNKKNKGFAFIEFGSPACVAKVLEAFGSAGCRLPTSMPAENLLSIQTFEDDGGHSLFNQGRRMKDVDFTLPLVSIAPCNPKSEKEDDKLDGKRKRSSTEPEEDGAEAKKVKTDPECDAGAPSNSTSSVADASMGDEGGEDSEGDSNDDDQDGNDSKKKRPRLRNYKKGKKKGTWEVATLGLRVLSKQEWKRLRNKYLNLQREKMSALKKQLVETRLKEAREKQEQEAAQQEKTNGKSAPDYTFIPGVILQFTPPELIPDIKAFKVEARSHAGVAYVDIVADRQDVFVRCESAEAAAALLVSNPWQGLRLLTGEEETLYWSRLQEQRQAKLTTKNNKKRGRDKLLARLHARQENFAEPGREIPREPPPQRQHIRFDEEDEPQPLAATAEVGQPGDLPAAP